MSFQWSDDLRTGMPEIDAQHQALLSQLNDLIEACSQRKGKEEISRFLSFLNAYVNRHFDDEERVMESATYSGLSRHREEHAKYRQKLRDLVDRYEREGASEQIVSDSVWMAGEWFIEHIRQTDMAMAGVVRKRSELE